MRTQTVIEVNLLWNENISKTCSDIWAFHLSLWLKYWTNFRKRTLIDMKKSWQRPTVCTGADYRVISPLSHKFSDKSLAHAQSVWACAVDFTSGPSLWSRQRPIASTSANFEVNIMLSNNLMEKSSAHAQSTRFIVLSHGND